MRTPQQNFGGETKTKIRPSSKVSFIGEQRVCCIRF